MPGAGLPGAIGHLRIAGADRSAAPVDFEPFLFHDHCAEGDGPGHAHVAHGWLEQGEERYHDHRRSAARDADRGASRCARKEMTCHSRQMKKTWINGLMDCWMDECVHPSYSAMRRPINPAIQTSANPI